MSGRRETERDRGDRERERERGEREKHRERESEGRRQPPPPSTRSHEYFVPRDGIDREVITADICRYLGNDALVRPGSYENPQTRQVQQGYFINAYRNLTTAMIADLKVDSERWETERRAASGGRPINGTSSRDSSGFGRPSNIQPAPQYIGSRTQHEREYYGPSEAPAQVTTSKQGGYPASSAAPPQQQVVYDGGYQSSQQQHQPPPQQSYVQPSAGPYGQQTQQGGYPIHQEPHREYAFGEAYRNAGSQAFDPHTAGRVPVTPAAQQIPRGDVYSPSGPGPTYPPQDRNPYSQYSSQPAVTSAQYSQQPADQYYGRAPVAPPVPQYDTAMDYTETRPSQYQDPNAFSQASMSSAFSQAPMSSGFSAASIAAPINPTITTGVPNARRGDRDDRRRDDRDGRHHRRP